MPRSRAARIIAEMSRSCLPKKEFKTKVEAEAQARAMESVHGKKKGRGFHVYHCRFCQSWHVGHEARRRIDRLV